MKRLDHDLGQWKCPKCGFEAVCRKCGLNPVHPHRKWQLCMDCVCDLLDSDSSVHMQKKWKEYRNDWQSNKAIRIRNERYKNGGKENDG